jgi:endogenous inhibitor of DNA gyrase (YacG/DUF329 family)
MPSPTHENPMIKVSCPTCAKVMEGASLAELPNFPFCSKRCKLVDLGRWLDGTYRVEPQDEEDHSPLDTDVP